MKSRHPFFVVSFSLFLFASGCWTVRETEHPAVPVVALPEGKTYGDYLDPDSAHRFEGCALESSLADSKPGDRFQFVRNGFFCADCKDSKEGQPVFNRIVSLKSSFKLPTAN